MAATSSSRVSEAAPYPAPSRWLPAAVLALTLGLTVLVCTWSVRAQRDARRALFERRVETFGQALAGQVQSYIDTLPGLRLFGSGRRSPSDAEFRRYLDAISLQQRFPGLALTFTAELVPHAQRDAFVSAVRDDRSLQPVGHPGFVIEPPGDRASYMVLRQTYPPDRGAMGYDLYDPAQRYRAAVDAAVASGGYVATGPVLLARDRQVSGQPMLTSVVIRAAVYAGGVTPPTEAARVQAATGVVGVSFRSADLVKSVMPHELANHAHLHISDHRAAANGEPDVLFDSSWLPESRQARLLPTAPTNLSIQVADRTWDVAFTDLDPVLVGDRTTALLLALGVALSASLAIMTRMLVQANARAQMRIRSGRDELERGREQLADSEGRYRMLFENSMDAVLRTRPDGTILAANASACALFGYDEAQLRSLGRAQLIDPTDPRLAGLLETRRLTGRAQGQLRMRRADGSLFEAELVSGTYRDSDGQVVAGLVVRDVTERQTAAEQQARLMAILDATPDFVGSSGPDGQHLFLNRAGRRMLGRGEDEDLSRLQLSDCHPPWAERLIRDEGLPTAMRVGHWTGRTAIRAGAGREIPVSQLILCHRNPQGEITHLSTVAHDLSEVVRAEAERQALELRLHQSQKMESIGTLAGGVAHDFNNVLAAVLGSAAMAREHLGDGHPSQPHLDVIQQAAARARTLVQQILTFSRRTPQERLVQPLQPLVEEALSMLRATLPAALRLESVLGGETLFVLAAPAQVQQVVLNLCTNAWQALPGGEGRVTVDVDRVELGPLAPAGLAPGEYARLRVHDDGVGMDEPTRARIFDPFFTTKPVGQGTGLGLAVVHGIVASAGGAITVDSAPARGSCFAVYLPLAAAPAPTAPRPAAPEPVPPAARGEELLYVDDDEVVALTVSALLRRLGYRVTCMAEPDAALRAVRAAPERFAMLITDFNMPGMSGQVLAEAVLALCPQMPVIISSGFVTEDLRERALQAGVRAILLKEYSLERLGTLVGEILNDPQPARA